MDVIFGLAVSSTTSEMDYEHMKSLVKTAIDSADVESGSTRIGFFVYGSGVVWSYVPLDGLETRSELHTALDSFQFIVSDNRSVFSFGLHQAEILFSFGNRDSVPDMLYMILDNSVDLTAAYDIAMRMKAARIQLDYVSVGFSDLVEMSTLGHVLEYKDFEALQLAVITGEFYRDPVCSM